MSRKCEICGKESHVGNRISHSHHKTTRKWHPNLQTVRVLVGGRARRMTVCASCIQKGRVNKP